MSRDSNLISWTLLPQRVPMFELVARRLEEMIEAEQWKKGEMLPSEVELAEQFRVAQGTMRRALRILTEKGILLRHQGRGTFVADYQTVASSVAERYVRLVPDSRIPALPNKSDVTLFEEIPAPQEVAEALQIALGDPVIHVKRVHYISQSPIPVSFDEHFLPKTLFHAMTRDLMAKHTERVLYVFYQNAFGVTVTSYTEDIKADLLDEETCERFDLEMPFPVLVGRRIAMSFGQKPVEYRIQHYTTKDYHFRIAF